MTGPVRLRPALFGIAALCAAAAAAPAAAQGGPGLPAPESLWQTEFPAPEGWAAGFNHALAIAADGTVLVVAEFEKKTAEPTGTGTYRYLLAALAPDGKKAWQHALPVAEMPGPQKVRAAAGPAPEFTVAWTDHRAIRLFRAGAVGIAAAGSPALAARGRAQAERDFDLQGMALGPGSRVALYGGEGLGPHAPWVAVLNPQARLIWEYAGRHAMPPGWVQHVRFDPGGALDSIVVDREKPFFERRDGAGALRSRAPLPQGWCRHVGPDFVASIYAAEGQEEKPFGQIVDRAGRVRATVALELSGRRDASDCLTATVAGDAVLFVADGARAAYADADGRLRGRFALGPAAWTEYRVNAAEGRYLAFVQSAKQGGAVRAGLVRLPEPAAAR